MGNIIIFFQLIAEFPAEPAFGEPEIKGSVNKPHQLLFIENAARVIDAALAWNES